jgi:WD40 repeat protein
LAFSPDGRRLVSGGDDRLVKVWDWRTGKEVLSLEGHTASVQSVAYSPDGTRIASASGRYDGQANLHPGEAKVWDAQTGRELLTLRGDAHGLNCVAFSPDGKLLACGGDGNLTVWDGLTGQQLLSFPAHDDSIVGVAFSPDGQAIATASYDKTVKPWETGSGKHLLSFLGHKARVTCVVFSPDGKRLASEGDDRTIRVIVAGSGEEDLSLKGTLGPVHSLAFSPDGNLLVSGGWDRLLRVWDARPLDGEGGDGQLLGRASRPARSWSLSSGRPRHRKRRPRTAREAMKKQRLLRGWTEKRTRDLVAHYDEQTDDEQALEAALSAKDQTVMIVPTELVPAIQALIARKRGA